MAIHTDIYISNIASTYYVHTSFQTISYMYICTLATISTNNSLALYAGTYYAIILFYLCLCSVRMYICSYTIQIQLIKNAH